MTAEGPVTFDHGKGNPGIDVPGYRSRGSDPGTGSALTLIASDGSKGGPSLPQKRPSPAGTVHRLKNRSVFQGAGAVSGAAVRKSVV